MRKYLVKEYAKLARQNAEIVDYYGDIIFLLHQTQAACVKRKVHKFKKDHLIIPPTEAFNEFFLTKAIANLEAHLELIKSGHPFSGYNQLRSVYEHILKIYLCICDRTIAELNWQYEMREKLLAEKRLLLTEKKHLEVEYKSKRHLQHSFIRSHIYTTKLEKSLQEFYEQINMYVHPSITGAAPVYEVKPHTFVDSIKLAISLAVICQIVEIEIYSDYVTKYRLKKISTVFAELQYYIPEGIPALIPNKINQNLKYKSYAQFIESIEE